MGRFKGRSAPSFAVAVVLASIASGLFAVATGSRIDAGAAGGTFYFHGAGTPQDDANRANSAPTATFDSKAPAGTSDSSQTAGPDSNSGLAANPISIYWVGAVAPGTYAGTLHLDWWWEAQSPSDAAFAPDLVDIALYADADPASNTGTPVGGLTGAKISAGTTGPLENRTDVPIGGPVTKNLLIEVSPEPGASDPSLTVHYDSTAVPSFFTLPAATHPLPSPSPPPIKCVTFCFSKPLVLPASGDTGGFTKTCYSPCGEPSLAVSPVDGTLYVSTPRTIVVCCNSQASPVWRSGDDGTTWSQPIFPSSTVSEAATTGGDTELAVDKRGTVYEGELWLGSDSIYYSPDKGATWDWSPASHDVGADREWFAYAPAEDALYGWYDGLKGLMVVKAPLTTPLGNNAARFFPLERVVVPECIDQAAACPPLPVNSVAGTPVLDGDVSPGRPSVSPVDGTVYFPFPFQVAGQGIGVAYTTDAGQSFQYTFVPGAGGGRLGDTGNDFPVSAVDSAGTLYVAWIENKGDGLNVYLASTPDKGQTWTKPRELSNGISKTALFPNVVAGSAGNVAVSWYGTSTLGDPNKLPAGASWNVYVKQILGVNGARPRVSTSVVQQGFHHGVICTQGAGCSGDTRKLLDFFDMKIDSVGRLLVVYARDVGKSNTEIAFSRQRSGCLLIGACRGGGATVRGGRRTPVARPASRVSAAARLTAARSAAAIPVPPLAAGALGGLVLLVVPALTLRYGRRRMYR